MNGMDFDVDPTQTFVEKINEVFESGIVLENACSTSLALIYNSSLYVVAASVQPHIRGSLKPKRIGSWTE